MVRQTCSEDSGLVYCLDAVNFVKWRGYLKWVQAELKDQSRCKPKE